MAAGDTFYYSGNRFILGQVGSGGAPSGTYAIWDGLDPNPARQPVASFPAGPEGWAQAWSYFAHWEPHPQPFTDTTTPPEFGTSSSIAAGSPTRSSGWTAQTPSVSPGGGAGSPWDIAPTRDGLGVPASGASRTRRAKALVTAGACLVLVAAGAGYLLTSAGSHGSADAKNVILAAYTDTTAAKTVHASISGSLSFSASGMSLSYSLSGTAQMDFAAQAVSISMSMTPDSGSSGASALLPSLTFNQVVANQTAYVQLPSTLSGQSAGPAWVSVGPNDLAAIAGQSGLSNACNNAANEILGGSPAVSSALGSSPVDPSQMLAELKLISNDVTDQGSETVNGVSSEHYHATVDLTTAITQAAGASCAAQLQKEMGSAGVSLPSMDVDAWIGNGLLQQEGIDLTMQMSASGQSGSIGMHFTMGFSDYGQPVSITPPPANEVESYSQFGNSLQGQAGSSGQSGGSPAPCAGWGCIAHGRSAGPA